jgi:hypothetical protein
MFLQKKKKDFFSKKTEIMGVVVFKFAFLTHKKRPFQRERTRFYRFLLTEK